MIRTESAANRGSRDGNGDVTVEGVDLARAPDARARIDLKRVSGGWTAHDPDDGGVSVRAETGLHAGDDHCRRAAEHRGRADR